MVASDSNISEYNEAERLIREGIDVICGGFPCQDISQAGKGLGLAGERSGLWRQMLRTICLVRPLYVIVENVAALLYRGMGTVLGDLASNGYDTEWDCVSASEIGAPHLRRRIYIMAYARGKFKHCPLFPKDRKKLGWSETIRGEDWEQFALVPGVPTGFGKWRSMGEPGLVREDDGVPDVLDRLKALGNAVVPQIPELIGKTIMKHSNVESDG